jgi:hypothetical protein
LTSVVHKRFLPTSSFSGIVPKVLEKIDMCLGNCHGEIRFAFKDEMNPGYKVHKKSYEYPKIGITQW